MSSITRVAEQCETEDLRRISKLDGYTTELNVQYISKNGDQKLTQE